MKWITVQDWHQHAHHQVTRPKISKNAFSMTYLMLWTSPAFEADMSVSYLRQYVTYCVLNMKNSHNNHCIYNIGLPGFYQTCTLTHSISITEISVLKVQEDYTSNVLNVLAHQTSELFQAILIQNRWI